MLKDRRRRPVVTHRIACGRPGSNRPEKLDYLEITTFERASAQSAYNVDKAAMDRLRSPEFGERYGAPADPEKPVKPRRIPIRVDSDEISDFLTQRYESTAMLPILVDGAPLTDSNGKVAKRPTVWCHGDGEMAQRLGRDMKVFNQIRCCSSPEYPARTQRELAEAIEAGASKHDPNDGKRCPFAQNTDPMLGACCKPVTTLICRSDVVANMGAFCRYRSHAHSSADYVVESLMEIKRQMPGGILRNVPLDLVLEMKQISRPGGRTALQPVCHIELRLNPEDTVRLIEANLQQQMRSLGAVEESRRLLAAARVDVIDEPDDGEFGRPQHPLEREQAPGGAFEILPPSAKP